MYTLINITKDDKGTEIRTCGTFDKLYGARSMMASEWLDGIRTEREWSDNPDSIDDGIDDRQAWIAGGDLYHESRWLILDPTHNPTDRILYESGN